MAHLFIMADKNVNRYKESFIIIAKIDFLKTIVNRKKGLNFIIWRLFSHRCFYHGDILAAMF